MWSPLLRNLSGDIGNNLVNKYVITNTNTMEGLGAGWLATTGWSGRTEE